MIPLLAHTACILFAPVLWTASSQQILSWLEGRWGIGKGLSEQLSFNFGFGLLLYVNLAFLLLLAGTPWPVATYLPLIPGFFLHARLRFLLNWKHLEPGLNLLLWFSVVLVIGVTLIQTNSGIATAWRNNYGDLAFHIGMLTSFIWGENIPPQFHLFAGERMSYPFLINLWTSLWWWPQDSWRYLSFLFAYQWVLLWMLLYFLLRGNQWRLLPWLVLLGGGSLTAVGNNSGGLIESNTPWTSFLTTIWVTQRSALFGTCMLVLVASVLIPALRALRSGGDERKDARYRACISSFAAGMMVLAHTHSFIVLILFAVLYVVASLSVVKERLVFLKDCAFAAIPGTIALLYLPWVVNKAPWLGDTGSKGMGHFMLGWGTGIGAKELSGLDRFSTTFVMWADAAAPLFLLTIALLVLSKRTLELVVLIILFIGANCVQLCYWEWDQIKVFLAIYALLISIWSQEQAPDNVPLTAGIYVLVTISLLILLSPTIQALLPAQAQGVLNPLSATLAVFGKSSIFMFGLGTSLVALLLLILHRHTETIRFCYQVLAVPLLVPSLIEVIQMMNKHEQFTVYSQEQISQAEKIRLHSEPTAIVQAAPNHNSVLTLTGRPLFYGYEGTLSSHGLDYQKRRSIAHNLKELASCRTTFSQPNLCPEYLFFEPQDAWWRGSAAPSSVPNFQRTAGVEGLYTIK